MSLHPANIGMAAALAPCDKPLVRLRHGAFAANVCFVHYLIDGWGWCGSVLALPVVREPTTSLRRWLHVAPMHSADPGKNRDKTMTDANGAKALLLNAGLARVTRHGSTETNGGHLILEDSRPGYPLMRGELEAEAAALRGSGWGLSVIDGRLKTGAYVVLARVAQAA